MYEKLENCPSCSHSKFSNYLICEDYTVSNESFALVKCDQCSLVFTNPRPIQEALSKYYKSDQYISHTDKGNSFVHFIYKLVRSHTLKQKEKLLRAYTEIGTVLDYGSGTGDFITQCERKNWETIGFEPDAEALSLARSKNKSRYISTLSNLKEEVDVITAWHVIEHVSELKETIKQLKKSLKKTGYIFIALPNIHSFDANNYGQHWAAYDVPRHLYHFERNSFTKLALSLKLQIIDIKPMKFDSFYVSMLSEKYKNGKNNFIKSLLTGLKSNKKAIETGEYSSLIYILKK